MKILMVFHSRDCGGAEQHVRHLSQGLQEHGHEVIFAGPGGSWLGAQVTRLGIPHVHVPLRGTYDLASVLQLVRIARHHGVDLLHGHQTRGAFYVAPAGRIAGKPAVGTVHSTNLRRHFGRLDRVIAVSEAVRASLGRAGVQEDRIAVVYNGIPGPSPVTNAERAAVRRTLGLGPSDIAVCTVARFIRDKGQDLLVDAVAAWADPRVRLFLIGQAEGEWYRQVYARADARGLGGRATFLGHREDVDDLLAAMDLYAAPSRREALGLSILEAQARGVPVVAADVGGIPEIIETGRNGLLFPADDAGALLRAMQRLAGDPACARELADRGMGTFRERFSLRAMVQGTMQVYLELLGKREPVLASSPGEAT